MSSAPFLSRHLGHYLLVAQLSEDPLGSVFRALYAADERRFVRLRILRSEELDPEVIDAMIRENAGRGSVPAHSAIVDRPQLDTVGGIPFMTWDETAGWTLDTMLARVRAFGIRIPAEYALLIAERIAAALEHVHRARVDGGAAHHGLLWPGFVSISHDAAVRVGGFGLAEGVIPALSRPRMLSEIAPYVASEVRQGGAVGARSDVYALGAILAELLTGRRPSLDTPFLELRAGDPRSEELTVFLYRCMAPAAERFASAVDAHREIQQMVTGNPFSLYTANLSLFLYKLLNPESQLAAPSSDWESTNPVVVSASSPLETPVPVAAVPEPLVSGPAAPALEAAAACDPPAEIARVIEADGAIAAAEALAGEGESPEPIAPTPEPEPFFAMDAADDRAPEAAPSATTFPEEARSPDPFFLEGPAGGAERFRPARLWSPEWTRPASALAAAAGLTVAAFLIVGQFHHAGAASAPRPRAVATADFAKTSAAAPSADAAARPAALSVAATAPMALVLAGPGGHFEPAVARATRPVKPGKAAPAVSRQPAEDLRLRAALARIEADRWNAKEAAGDIFGEGRHSEEEGERLLRQRDYDAAELAFSRAARLFQKAQEISWEERLRQSNLSPAQ